MAESTINLPEGFVLEGFDPEGAGYDYETAEAYGLKPDETGHWPSRIPQTGQILKGQRHPTYNLTVEGERKAGYEIVKGQGGKYYSHKPVSVPEGFVLTDVPSIQEQEGSYFDKLYGASMRGWMRLGSAVLDLPKHTVGQLKVLDIAGYATALDREKDPVKRAKLLGKASKKIEFYDNLTDELGKAGQIHRVGRDTILKNHPEWESEPPKSFIDLLSSPDKLLVALAESTPILLSAGILTAAGQPHIGVTMMYATEGQEAYDRAKIDKADDIDAESVYVIYGSISAALEQLQLQGIIKIAKGMFNNLRNRVVQKVARKGMKALTMPIIKVAAQEGLEEMAQGTWGEITAKMVYDKSVSGGLAGFIDRRLQEGYIGAAMGIIPGAGGAVAGRIQAQVQGKIADELNIKPEEVTEFVKEHKETIGLAPVIEKEEFISIQEKLDEAYRNNDIETFNKILEKELAPLPAEKEKNILQGHAEVLQMEMEKRQAKVLTAPVVEGEKKVKHLLEGILVSKKDKYEAAFRHLETGKIYKTGAAHFFNKLPKEIQDEFDEKPTQLIAEPGFVNKITGKFITSEDAIIAEQAPSAPEVAEKPKQITRKKAFAIGHRIPETLGWNEKQRRDFMEQTIGVRSMKDINLEKSKTLIGALNQKLKDAGLEYKPLPADELVETLERTRKITAEDPIKSMNRRGLYKLRHTVKSGITSFTYGLERIERFIEGLDGHKEGAHYKYIWQPIKVADETAIENTNRKIAEFISRLESQGIDTAIWLGKLDLIPGTKIELTATQRIGIYTLSQNEDGMRYLIKGMGLSPTEINAAKKFMGQEEVKTADWLLEQYEAQWPIVQQAAVQANIDPATLKKEYRYSPLIRTDVELEEQTDFLSELADKFRRESFSPEKGMLVERKKKAAGRIELDAFVIYMHNIARAQRFIAMAPAANKVGKILNNRKFKQALNDRTFNQGNKLLNSWMKDAVRGTSHSSTGWLSRKIAILRRNGILYAIGYNLPSSLRQALSMSNAMAVDPLMLKYNPGNIVRASTPSGYEKIENFVFDRSRLVKTRSYDRDLRQKWNRKTIGKKLRGKAPWSKQVMRWIRWMDKHTTVVAWKSLYDVGIEKFKGDEQQAINYADKWIGRTQPMANAKDLPDFFRAGTIEKLLTTFQNQINNNGNFYMYDILGAKKAGQISWPMVGYRLMFSYILPAMMFGMIGRAGPPRTLAQVIIDLVTYPIAPLVFINRVFDRIIKGWGQTETVAEIGLEAFVRFGKEIRKGRKASPRKIIKYAAQTIGGITGYIPAQAIRTTEGAMDLISGETKDLRRLIYSEWALKQGQPVNTSVGIYRRTH